MTPETGHFWFFDPANIELLVKMLDGSDINGYYWVFLGSLTNVSFELTVSDLETGTVKVYNNTSGDFASLGDTTAFPGSQP